MARGKYTVNEVEERTGVPAGTLRQWERRYGFPQPERSTSGYRLFSDHDLRGIETMKRHIADGVPASRAAELVKQRPPVVSDGTPQPPYALREELLAALLDLDETGADRVLSEAHTLHPLETVLVDIIQPAMVELGRRWHEGRVSTTTEHVASSYLHGRLRSLLSLTSSHSNNPEIVIACAPLDQHELGALMLAVLLRREGYRIVYVGANTPVDDLLELARQHRPLALMISASTQMSVHALLEKREALRASVSPIFYGGAAFNAQPHVADELGGHYLGSNVIDALPRFESLIRASESQVDAADAGRKVANP